MISIFSRLNIFPEGQMTGEMETELTLAEDYRTIGSHLSRY